MMDIKDNLENLSVSEALLERFLSMGIIDEKEHVFLMEKLRKNNQISSNSIFIKNKLINAENNESIQTKKDTI